MFDEGKKNDYELTDNGENGEDLVSKGMMITDLDRLYIFQTIYFNWA